MKLENKNIIIVSNEEWGNTWFSKHNYAWKLSEKNKVYFIDPPQKFSPLNIFKKNLIIKTPFNNITVIKYKNILPVKIDFLRQINEYFVLNKINHFLTKNKVYEPIFWTFDPIRLSKIEILKPSKVILHTVDKYLFTYKSEKILSKKADLIIAVDEEIAECYKPYNNKIIVVPHAIQSDEFLEEYKNISLRKRAVYVGNIDIRLDFKYMEYIIENFPDIDFYFIGKINDKVKIIFNSMLEKNKNIFHLGEKHAKELKYEIQKTDFCILFKDQNIPGNNIASHKMLQYFAQGKPIFSNILSHYKEISNLLYMENDKKKMKELIHNFITNGEDHNLREKRIEYAKKHTFDNALLKIQENL
jgi:hypothetical protein